jgi:Uma2 family endonuclease
LAHLFFTCSEVNPGAPGLPARVALAPPAPAQDRRALPWWARLFREALKRSAPRATASQPRLARGSRSVSEWRSAASQHQKREDVLMAQTMIDLPTIENLADLRKRLGGIPLERIRFRPAPGTATEDDVVRIEAQQNRLCELVDGTLVEKAMGFEEARVALQLGHLIQSHLDESDLGICVGADGMMRIAPGLVRIPDVSFIAWDRLPGRESPKVPIPDLVPDLAIEVLSEGNTPAEMRRKVGEYFDAGVRLVWLIDPEKRTARVYSAPHRSVLIRAAQSLDGGSILPGFAVRLADLLDRGRRPRKK